MNNTLRRTAYIYIFLSRSEKCIQFYYFHRFRNKRRKKSTRSLILHNDMYEYNLPTLSSIEYRYVAKKCIHSNGRIYTYTLGILHIQSNPFNTIPFFTRSTANTCSKYCRDTYIFINIIVLKAAIRYNVPSHRST